MKARELTNLGVPRGSAMRAAQEGAGEAIRAGLSRDAVRATISRVVRDPQANLDDPHFGPLAVALGGRGDRSKPFIEREQPAPWRMWGRGLDAESIRQLQNACRLPVSVKGALMPDAHVGYGLPIGGVLATENAVIPYAVGVDIACRMKMTVLDLPVTAIKGQTDRLINAIEQETRFGIGAKFRDRREHDVMDGDWSVSRITQQNKDKAWSQLGTSGSGNHFVEFGIFEIDQVATGDSTRRDDLGLEPGRYVALLSHSGSRGTGAQVAGHYSRVAMDLHPELPKELRHLAWLDLSSDAGREYWAAMNLMGEYAAANHAVIHREIARHLGARVLLDVENHHNFAWKETHEIDGEARDVIVHRKGATPAGKGVLGIIPGSMATPAFLVRGKGNAESLQSASHGAGRAMSRTAAKNTLSWSDARRLLAERDVHVISAGLDEVPFVYKDIHEVMAAQDDLVEVVGRFHPKVVKMAPEGERSED